jgi:hypothetical protein
LQENKNLMTASRCCWKRARRLTCYFLASGTRKDFKCCSWADPSFQRHYRFRPTTSGSMSVWEFISTPSYIGNAVYFPFNFPKQTHGQ